MENAANWPYATAPYWPKKLKIDTAAGWLASESRSTNGTKKFPQAWMNTKINTTPRPGPMSGSTIERKAASRDAPSTQAASSTAKGTVSMKFLVIQMAMGRLVADRNSTVAGRESNSLSCTNNPYTGTMMAVTGRQVPNRMP